MNIIITGVGKGIGYQLAKVFSKNSNNNLFLLSRSLESLNQLKKECAAINNLTKVEIIPFDLELIIKEGKYPVFNCKHVDILINNAGYLINKAFVDFDKEEMERVFNINFLAPTLLIKQIKPLLGGNDVSHIVNIGSMGGFQGSSKFPGLSIYSASKSALGVLTECLATEFKGENIYCNCLALGSVQTEMLELAFPGYKAPVKPEIMAEFIAEFAINGHKLFNGKILPVGHVSI
jgi:short-subunit dehydrogenase